MTRIIRSFPRLGRKQLLVPGLAIAVMACPARQVFSTSAEIGIPAPTTGIFPVVDTGQLACYDDMHEIDCPSDGQPFHGQDAQYVANQPSFTLSDDGLTVTDNVTGLTWQRSPDTNNDGQINIYDKLTWDEAQLYPAILNAEQFAGYGDWRLPSIKELYSLIDFSGTDPSMCQTEEDCPGLKPFIDDDYFDFAYGDIDNGERLIDVQYASDTLYVSTVEEELLFGVNFADGRIKGYGLRIMNQDKTFCVICVRGNTGYGVNDFVDNGDGTVTDHASGLMWQQSDSGQGLIWEDALDYAENLTHAGYDDWRLPNAKELQCILDYTRSPDTTNSAAIDPVFEVTEINNEENVLDYPYYWAGTTHVQYPNHGGWGAYMAFGRGLGFMMGQWRDVHGAGCQRSDPKFGDPDDYPYGHGPQGDAVRIYNFVRCVREAAACPEDVNFDGEVNVDDLFTVLSAWGQCGECDEDLNSDGVVDIDDIFAVLGAWGPCD